MEACNNVSKCNNTTMTKSLCHDFSSDRLLGRSAEESILLNAYFASLSCMSCKGGPASVILIRGDSGVGKTKLAERLRPHVLGDDGFFIRGKFDQISYYNGSASMPYSGIAPAFGDYCSQLEEQGEDEWNDVAQALRKQIQGDEGEILVEAIPALRKIIFGDRHEITDDGRDVIKSQGSSDSGINFTESRLHKLNYVMKKFIQVISTMGDPIVMLIDDMQWADTSSIDLLRTLIQGARNPFIFMLTYRPIEVDHQFHKLLEQLKNTDVCKTEISLTNLRNDCIHQLVANILRIDQESICRDFSEFICQVTNGNPFFARQQIISLFDEGLLSYDGSNWKWDIQQIKSDIRSMKDLVSMIVEKIKRLPGFTQQVLLTCACIGSNVDIYLLKMLLCNGVLPEAPDSCDSVRNAITQASREGLIKLTHDQTAVTFTHDSLHSAAYSLLEEENRAAFHLKIGRIILQHTDSDHFQKYLLTIANQLARGHKLILEQNERLEAAHIFFQAGEASKLASAFAEAQFFYSKGAGMISDRCWVDNYSLSCDIYLKLAEVDAITGDYEDMDRLLNVVSEMARESPDDRLRAYYIKINSLHARYESAAGVDLAVNALELVGLKFPKKRIGPHTKIELAKTRRMMKGMNASELLKLPPAINKQVCAAMRILHLAVILGASSRHELLPLLALRIIQLNLKHGISTDIPTAIAVYGSILINLGIRFSEASEHAETALILQNHFDCKESIATIATLLYGVIFPYTKKLSECTEPLMKGFHAGMETGNILHAMQCAKFHIRIAFHSGQPLPQVLSSLQKYNQCISELNETVVLQLNRVYQQAVVNFLGCSGASLCPERLQGNFFDYNALSRSNKLKQLAIHEYATSMQMETAYFFGNYSLAWTMSELLANSTCCNYIVQYTCVFYRGMAATAMLRVSENNRQCLSRAKFCLKILRKAEKKSIKNISHQMHLLTAELASCKKQYKVAEKHYLAAIEHAKSSGVTHEHALALERFGYYFLSRNLHDAAYQRVREAHKLYTTWGSRPKCESILKKFPRLLEEDRVPVSRNVEK